MKFPPLPVLQRLAEFDTALLANTIGYIDPTPAHQYYLGGSIRSLTPSLAPTVGIAVTCELDSSTPAGKAEVAGYWKQLEEMSAAPVPTIWVVKCVGSRPDHECVIGDGMAKTLHSVGCVGLVTDGGVRDLNGIVSTSLAVYARGTVIHHTALRIRRTGIAVKVGGVTIRPGDLVHANAEGVILIPRGCAEKLPEAAIRMRAFEYEAHLALRRTDLTLAEKRKHVETALSSHGFAGRSETHVSTSASQAPRRG